MKMRKNTRKRLFAVLVVTVMVATLLSTCLLMNAGAISSSVTVGGHGTDKNTELPTTLQPGEVWTGKTVTETASPFGDGANGKFGIKFLALGGEIDGNMPLIQHGTDPDLGMTGLAITDTYNSNYTFVFKGADIPFYINGSGTELLAVLQSGSIYEYTGKDFVVEFDTAQNTVKYTIAGDCLELLGKGSQVSATTVFNALEFGLTLKDTATAATTYKTNLDDSCIAEFNALQSNPYYWSETTTTTHTNINEFIQWDQVNVVKNRTWFPEGTLESLSTIQLFYDSTNYYEFTGSDITKELSSDVDIGDNSGDNIGDHEWNWIVGVLAGDAYIKDAQLLKIADPADPAGYYKINVHIWEELDEWNHVGRWVQNAHLSGALYKGTLVVPADAEFIVNILPLGVGKDVSVTVGDTNETFIGTIAAGDFTSPTSWKFTMGTTQLELIDGKNLTVTKVIGYWKNTDDGSFVQQTHDAYGYVTLTTPYIPNIPTPSTSPVATTGSLTVSKIVSEGDSKSEIFTFTVTFAPGTSTNNNDISGITAPSIATGANGIYTLSLSANDAPVTFANIPAGTTYSVTETITAPQSLDGWSADTVNTRNTTGTITEAGVSAVVANEQAGVLGTSDVESPSPSPSSGVAGDADVLPQTDGITTSTLLGIFGLAIIAIGGTAFTIVRKKYQG